MSIRCCAFAVGVLVLVALPGPSHGADAAKKGDGKASSSANAAQAGSGGWTVRCDNSGEKLACKALQSIVLAKTRQLLISIAVSKPKKGEDAAMLLQLPHGLYNPAGLKVSIDDGAVQSLEIQTCDAKGCYAGMPITPQRHAAMTKGKAIKVVFQNLKKQSITVPVPLKGYEAAYKKL